MFMAMKLRFQNDLEGMLVDVNGHRQRGDRINNEKDIDEEAGCNA
jgi:hypothetical protein